MASNSLNVYDHTIDSSTLVMSIKGPGSKKSTL